MHNKSHNFHVFYMKNFNLTESANFLAAFRTRLSDKPRLICRNLFSPMHKFYRFNEDMNVVRMSGDSGDDCLVKLL